MALLKTVSEITLARINECVTAVSSYYLLAVRAIYGSTKQERPEHIGSCILLNLRGTPLLLTAAHVIDNNAHTTLYVGGKTSLVQIDGDFLATTAPEGSRDRDRHDFAIWKIPPHIVSELGDVKYIIEGELAQEAIRNEGRLFLVLGYPNTKNKGADISKKAVKSELWKYASTAKSSDSLAKTLGISGTDHLFVGFNKKRSKDSAGNVVHSIKPTGVSGGALIDLGFPAHPKNLGMNTDCRGLLAGLLIEFHAGHSLFVATRITTILRAIDAWLIRVV